jgi:hypothetical protein
VDKREKPFKESLARTEEAYLEYTAVVLPFDDPDPDREKKNEAAYKKYREIYEKETLIREEIWRNG